MIPFQIAQAGVAVMARVDVENDQLVGDDAEIGLRRLQAEPGLDDAGLGRCAEQAVGGELADRVLGRRFTAAVSCRAGADQLAGL